MAAFRIALITAEVTIIQSSVNRIKICAEIRASKASVDDVVPCNNLNFTITPHPSGYAAHLPLKGKVGGGNRFAI